MLGLSALGSTAIADVLGGGNAPPVSTTRYGDRFVGKQEQPWHPGSFLWPKAYPTNVAAPSIRNQIFITQEQPFHPSSRFFPGPPGPNVFAQPIRNQIFITQEQPSHPGNLLIAPKQFQNIGAPTIRTAIIRQEYPLGHPNPIARAGVFTDILRVTNFIYLRQEQPAQFLWPAPPVRSGNATPSETVYAFVIH